jgi:hypothetical protein
MFLAFLLRGLSLPAHEFLHGLLFVYGVQLHQLTPNWILHNACFITLCESCRLRPSVSLDKNPELGGAVVSEGFRSIENKKISYEDEQEQPRSNLRDVKQRARDIRSTYPCRSHNGNVQMNVVGVVVLASPPRDPIRSKRHNG